MTPTPIKSLLDAATPGPWIVGPYAASTIFASFPELAPGNRLQLADMKTANHVANAQLIARLSPATVRAVVEALIDSHLYIDDGLEGNPAKRKAMLLQIERALALLNGEELP